MSFILSIFLTLFSITAPYSTNYAQIVVSACHLFTTPSFESAKVLDLSNEEIILKQNDSVLVLEESGDFALVQIDNTIRGYVYKYYLSYGENIDVYPTFNATIRHDGTQVYNLDYSQSNIVLDSGTRVFIYGGYDDKNEYTAIQFVDGNGTLIHGFVQTSNINPDGVSSLLIVGISIIVACVTIILSIIFIKKSRSNKKSKPSK